MMANPENPTEFYFDVSSGQLLIGQLAVDMHIEAGNNPADVYSLSYLLTNQERIVGPKKFEPLKYSDWDSQDDVPSAKWLHDIVNKSSQQKVLSEEVITRAGYLRLIPRPSYFKKRPGHLNGLYKEAELENTRSRSAFDSWTTEDFIDYMHRLATTKQRKPTIDDIKIAGRLAYNPNRRQICERFGNLGVLFELAGYVHARNWTRNDFINWGVKFMEANDGKLPTSRSMARLASKNLSPNPTTIQARDDFSSILDFQTEVMFAYEEKMQYKKEVRETQLLEISRMLGSTPELKSMAERAKDEDDSLRIFAKFRLMKHFMPDVEPKTVSRACMAKDPSKMMGKISESLPDLTAADIETQAEAMHVYDIIWPMDSYLQNLKVA